MRRREFLALLGGALACSIALAARAGAQQLPPPSRSAPPAQPPPQPVPQVTPQLNVPGPQVAPPPPGNPLQQLAPLGGRNRAVSTGRIRRRGARRSHRRPKPQSP